jgi:hypothetical protein
MQVAHAAEQALRALQVTDKERNAILEAFRYKEARMAATLDAAVARADAVVQAAAAETADAGSIPFTRCVLYRAYSNMTRDLSEAPVASEPGCRWVISRFASSGLPVYSSLISRTDGRTDTSPRCISCKPTTRVRCE